MAECTGQRHGVGGQQLLSHPAPVRPVGAALRQKRKAVLGLQPLGTGFPKGRRGGAPGHHKHTRQRLSYEESAGAMVQQLRAPVALPEGQNVILSTHMVKSMVNGYNCF